MTVLDWLIDTPCDIYQAMRTSGIRHETKRIVWLRIWLRLRYGYERGLVTVWGDWRWTHRAARRELMDALEKLGL